MHILKKIGREPTLKANMAEPALINGIWLEGYIKNVKFSGKGGGGGSWTTAPSTKPTTAWCVCGGGGGGGGRKILHAFTVRCQTFPYVVVHL